MSGTKGLRSRSARSHGCQRRESTWYCIRSASRSRAASGSSIGWPWDGRSRSRALVLQRQQLSTVIAGPSCPVYDHWVEARDQTFPGA